MNNFLIKITILTLFVFYPSISSASGNGETFRQLELFGDIFEKVRKFYVEDTNDKKLIESENALEEEIAENDKEIN